jgi:ribosome maturation factor RimP
MQGESQIGAISRMTEGLLTDPKHFLVDVRIKATNNVKVFIDGDEGIPLSELIRYNRKLYKQLEESGLFPADDFSLEVSSPGLDEPLKLLRQYKKNLGRYVDVLLADTTQKEGKLLRVNDDSIVIETETGKGKKKEIKEETILFNDIKSTKIQIRF